MITFVRSLKESENVNVGDGGGSMLTLPLLAGGATLSESVNIRYWGSL